MKRSKLSVIIVMLTIILSACAKQDDDSISIIERSNVTSSTKSKAQNQKNGVTYYLDYNTFVFNTEIIMGNMPLTSAMEVQFSPTFGYGYGVQNNDPAGYKVFGIRTDFGAAMNLGMAVAEIFGCSKIIKTTHAGHVVYEIHDC